MSICRHGVVCLMMRLVAGYARVLMFSILKGLVGEETIFCELCGVDFL